MKHGWKSLEELPAGKNPLGFLNGEFPFKLSQLEDLKVEERGKRFRCNSHLRQIFAFQILI